MSRTVTADDVLDVLSDSPLRDAVRDLSSFDRHVLCEALTERLGRVDSVAKMAERIRELESQVASLDDRLSDARDQRDRTERTLEEVRRAAK